MAEPSTLEQPAAAMLFPASDGFGYVNGEALMADGGWTAG